MKKDTQAEVEQTGKVEDIKNRWNRAGALAQWLREATRNQKVVCLNPGTGSGWTFFHVYLL